MDLFLQCEPMSSTGASGVTIIGAGSYVPGEPVTNEALSRVMDTSDEWIRARTGIAQRHYAPEGTGCSDLAVEAARRALANANVRADEVDYIVFCTMTPDYVFPGSGGLLGAKLGIPGVPALDIRQQCAAMIFGLQVADGLVKSGAAKTLLLVGAEAHAGFMPWDDWDVLEGRSDREVTPEARARATRHRGLAILFGDGAGALVLRASGEQGRGLIATELHSDGNFARLLHVEGGGFRRRPYWDAAMFTREEHIPRMEGTPLFKFAVQHLPAAVRTLCARQNVSLDDVDWFIAHQANDRINESVRRALGVPAEKVPSNIARYGNTSAATIPILLDEMFRDGKLHRGQLLCFLALGAGIHYGASLLRL